MLTNIYIQLLIIAGLLQDYQLRVHKLSVTAGLSEQLTLVFYSIFICVVLPSI